MKNAEAVTFAGSSLDRASQHRANPEELARLRSDPAARCLPLWRNKPLLNLNGDTALGWVEMDAAVLDTARDTEIFLGLENGAPRFAVMIPDWETAATEDNAPPFVDQSRQTHPDLPETFAFGELRAVMSELSQADSGNAAAARGIFAWHERHKFCANCGAKSEVDDAGWRRTCPTCKAQHFPRTDPVVIMLILHGNNVLLGRSPVWPEGMYSLLAGFMEPGESIEAAVRRETREESSIIVGDVSYLSSQPWPFPSSLMIGCLGHAVTTDIICDRVELEDAKWVSRETVLSAMHGGVPWLKPSRKGSIARFLLDRWLADDLR